MLVYVGGTTHDVTWNVVGTDNSPINATSVDIYMSEDGGYTWPHAIGNFPNTGSASIPFPNPDTTTTKARIKVKGHDNVFFNVNRDRFTVTHGDGLDTTISIKPVPTHTVLRVSSGNKGELRFRIYNSIGRLVNTGTVNGLIDIPVYLWPRDMYIIKFEDPKNNRTVKKFVVD